MAVLDVDEARSRPAAPSRAARTKSWTSRSSSSSLRIRTPRREAAVEHGMVPGAERLGAVPVVGPRVAARVRELQADHEVARGAPAVGGLVLGDERLAQARERRQGRLADHQLARVGAAVVAHGDGFAAPDQLGAGAAEVAPAALGELRRLAGGRPVPSLHRQDAEAVPGAQAVRLERLARTGSRPGAAASRRNRGRCRPPRGGGGRPRRCAASRREPSPDHSFARSPPATNKNGRGGWPAPAACEC